MDDGKADAVRGGDADYLYVDFYMFVKSHKTPLELVAKILAVIQVICKILHHNLTTSNFFLTE